MGGNIDVGHQLTYLGHHQMEPDMKHLLFSGAVLVAAACAPVNPGGVTTSTAASPCFETSQVANFRIENHQQVYIRSQRGNVFRLDGSPNCFDIGASSVSVEPYGGASLRMCPGNQVRVRVVDEALPPRTCIATVSDPITDSAVSGFPARR